MTSSPGPSRPAGFTLLEMMVVVVIVGTLLLLVPANLAGFGARSRLEASANTLVSVFANARQQAIQDGFEVRVEIGAFKDEAGRHEGHRLEFTNVPPPTPGQAPPDMDLDDAERRREAIAARGRERQWLTTMWHPLPEGVEFAGFSEEAKRWSKVSDGSPYRVSFLPDGSVSKAFAVRLESQDLDARREDRSMTILMNGLTAEAQSVEGDAEVSERREARDFP